MATDEERIRRAAADWFARRQGAAHPGDDRAFAAWREADPRHAAAYDRLEGHWRASAALAGRPIAQTAILAPAPWARLARPAGVAGGLGLATALGAILWITLVPSATPLTTPLGAIRTVALADGSRVTLDADSSVIPEFADGTRRVRLVKGRARFTVAPDTRPFVVEAGGALIVDRGTVFDVDRHGDAVEVALLKGRVDVRARSAAPAASVALSPGQRIAVTAAGKLAAPRALPPGADAWVSGTLVFDNTPLVEVLAAANRYSATQIVLADPAAGAHAVTGSFRTGQPAQLADALAALFGLEVRRAGPHRLLLAAPRSGG